MPRSRSMSIESRYWARMSRISTAPVISRIRSASVRFPWSMWAMMLRQRSRSRGITSTSWWRCGRVAHCPSRALIPANGRLSPPADSLSRFPRHEDEVATPMANIKSQKKRNVQNEKRRVRNLAVRSELKTRVKGATAAAETGAEDAAERLVLAQKRIDKAGSKGDHPQERGRPSHLAADEGREQGAGLLLAPPAARRVSGGPRCGIGSVSATRPSGPRAPRAPRPRASRSRP